MNLLEPIYDDAAAMRALRRDLHAHPELSYQEQRTSDLIATKLTQWGIPVHRGLAQTGVVGVIKNGHSNRALGLRADIDALPIAERNSFAHASTYSGKMHACGHDGHTAMLLAAARYLSDHRNFDGTVYLIFQPAEEGPGGALPMIEAGAMDDPKVDAVAMLHVDVRLDTGTIGVMGGVANAAADEFHITIEGKGGHGASPHTAVDAIPCAAAVVLALQNIAAREIDPMKTVVVTIGTIEGGYRNNIIADRVSLTGTFRSQDPVVRDGLEARARRIIEGVASAYGTRATLNVIYGYPPVVNDPRLAASFRNYLERETGFTVAEPPATMGGEDFAYFAQRAPGLMVRLGVRDEAAGSVHPGHSPLFRLDERALAYGIETLAAFARGVGSGAVSA